jgi:DNA-binding NarL/FixJ family response regulator
MEFRHTLRAWSLPGACLSWRTRHSWRRCFPLLSHQPVSTLISLAMYFRPVSRSGISTRMPCCWTTGLDLAHVLHKQRPDIALIILTKFPDPRTAGVETTLIPPGCGFLRKDKVRDTDYLLQSIEAALTDRGGDIRDVEEAHPLSGLSAKHLAVLRLIATGYTNEHIATLKDASQSTVERWVVEIFRTLQIDTRGILNPRVEAARRFIAVAGIPERL